MLFPDFYSRTNAKNPHGSRSFAWYIHKSKDCMTEKDWRERRRGRLKPADLGEKIELKEMIRSPIKSILKETLQNEKNLLWENLVRT